MLAVEFYRTTHGEYPDSLATLKRSLPKDTTVTLTDPRVLRGNESDRLFYYQRVGADHYYLRGVAPDGNPFSPGALVPQVGASKASTGLLIDPQVAPPR
jgi:hypothetical protein